MERAAKDGDIAVIDFEGFDNGVSFDGGKGEDYELELGSDSFVPGFEEQVVGMNAGEEKDLEHHLPRELSQGAGGQARRVPREGQGGQGEQVIPEQDDEFAKDVSEFETLDELKADIKSQAVLNGKRKIPSSHAY